MPFQIVFSFKPSSAGVIYYFTAGDDFSSICSSSGTLTATISGDETGHAFWWDQVSGSAVTWTTPRDQKEVSFTVVAFDDKTFRFWIDKGTANQQYSEVTVFGTPTTLRFFGTSPASYKSPNSVMTPIPVALLATHFPSTMQPQGTSLTSCDPNNYVITWNSVNSSPDHHTLVEYTVAQKIGTGSWSTMATYQPTDARYYLVPTLEAQYRVVAKYRKTNSGEVISAISNVVSSPTSRNTDNVHVIEGTAQRAFGVIYHSPSVSNYTALLFTKTLLGPEISQRYFGGTTAHPRTADVSNYTALLFTKTLLGPEISQRYFGGTTARPRTADVSNYQVEDLTGGGIGGGG